MCNSIFIGKKTIPKAEDGEKIKVMIEGVYFTDDEGVRKLDVMKVDGEPVMDPDESRSLCKRAHQDFINQDSDDALRLFIIKTKKG